MKYCYHCGAENMDTASFCASCGTNIISTGYVPPQVATPIQEEKTKDEKPAIPETYLWQSVLVTILCCMPLGIIAIINSAQVETRYYAGNYPGAESASRNARNLAIAGLITGAVISILYIALFFFGALGSLNIFNDYYQY